MKNLKPPSIFHNERKEDLSRCGVYCMYFLKNPNKVYVGSTKISGNPIESGNGFWTRWRMHLYYFKRSKGHTLVLQEAYNKYGLDNIYFKILEIIEDKSSILEREQFWINKLNSHVNGYNTNPFSDGSRGKVVPKNLWGKKVIQYDTNGNKIAEYATAREATRQTGISYKDIHKNCVGQLITSGNYVWRFENDPFLKYRIIPKIDVRKKIIRQYSLDGNFMREFNTISEASRECNITLSNISMCLRGQRNMAGGYKWVQVN